MIRKTRMCLSENLVHTLYKSLVLPNIDLGDVLYDLATNELTNKLQLVQNSACRVVLLCGKRNSTDKMHRDLKLLKLKDRRQMHLQHINHKNIHETGSLSKLLVRKNGERVQRTRHANELTLFEPRMKTNKGRCAYSYRGPYS